MSGAPALAAPQYSQAGTNRLVSMLELELKNARLSNDASKQTVLLDAERVAWFF